MDAAGDVDAANELNDPWGCQPARAPKRVRVGPLAERVPAPVSFTYEVNDTRYIPDR